MSRGLFKIYLGIVFPDETMGFEKVLNIKGLSAGWLCHHDKIL